MNLVLVLVGGAAGAPARWYLDQVIQGRHDRAYPWGTFIINVLGSFLLGALLGGASVGGLTHGWVVLLGVGFCGAFTTFSTFGFEAVRLIERGRAGVGAAYVLSSLAAACAAAALGWAIGAAAWA